MGVIFIAGVFAVGKTTLCNQVNALTGIPHFTASGLIKAEKANAISKTDKKVINVENNQQLLIKGLQRVIADQGCRLMLDGHFTLPNVTGQIEPVSLSVFEELQLAKVVLLHDEPAQIASRFNARDGKEITVEEVREHQDKEISHANNICEKLNIPLIMLRAFDPNNSEVIVKACID